MDLSDDFCDDLLRLCNIRQDIERPRRLGRRRNGKCIERPRRLGRRRNGKSRPVEVKFLSYRVREKVHANASRLAETRYTI